MLSVRMVEAVELLACHVFSLAERDETRVSMELVRKRLAELAKHPRGCCPLCVAAAKASPADVYKVAKQWQWKTTVTRVRALR
jgi:hypothetical protein